MNVTDIQNQIDLANAQIATIRAQKIEQEKRQEIQLGFLADRLVRLAAQLAAAQQQQA